MHVCDSVPKINYMEVCVQNVRNFVVFMKKMKSLLKGTQSLIKIFQSRLFLLSLNLE